MAHRGKAPATVHPLPDLSNASKKFYSVAIQSDGVEVTQTIRYFLRLLDDPSQVKGAFDVMFKTTIDPTSHAVIGTHSAMTNPFDDLPLHGAMTQLMR